MSARACTRWLIVSVCWQLIGNARYLEENDETCVRGFFTMFAVRC